MSLRDRVSQYGVTFSISAGIPGIVQPQASLSFGLVWDPQASVYRLYLSPAAGVGASLLPAAVGLEYRLYNPNIDVEAVAGWSFSASAASGVVMGGIWNTDGDQIGEITGVQTNVSVSGDAGYTFIIGGDLKATPYDPPEDASGLLEYHFPRCFLAGTPILMADGQEKPIEDIRVGDMVMSFDPSADQGRGALVPKPVSRTFQNVTRSIIDLRGLYMTPGHVCLTDDGRFETIAEILLRDGILIEADGTPIRARTGAKVGSMEDIPVLIAYPDEKTGKEIFVRARAGIPCRLVRERDGTKRHLSLALMLRAYHQTLTPEGLIISPDGSLGEATDWPEDSTPMDEDYRRNWVIQTADGKPYVPEWIAAVAEEAREEQTVGATLQRIISPPSVRFTPKVVDNPTPRVNARR